MLAPVSVILFTGKDRGRPWLSRHTQKLGITILDCLFLRGRRSHGADCCLRDVAMDLRSSTWKCYHNLRSRSSDNVP